MRTLLGGVVGPFTTVWANRRVRSLLWALTGSQVGSWLWVVALGVYVYGRAGAGWVGVVLVSRSVCSAAASMTLGVLADRYPKRMVMVWSDAGRAVLLSVATIVVWASSPIWLLAVVAGLAAIVGASYPSAMYSLLPGLVDDPAVLSAANAATSTIIAVACLAGPALGAAVLAVSSATWVFAVCVMAVSLSALILLVHPDLTPTPTTDPAQARPELSVEVQPPGAEENRGPFADMTAGLRAARQDARLALLLGVVAVITFVFGAMNVLVVAVAFAVLGMHGGGASLLFATNGAGSVIGAIAGGAAAARRAGLALAGAVVAMGVTLALFAATGVVLVAIIMIGLNGVAASIGDIADTTLGQRVVPSDLLGRYMGLVFGVIYASTAIGSVAAPLLIRLTTQRDATLITGATLAFTGLGAWRGLTRLDDSTPTPNTTILAALRHDPIFATLPEAALELLAQAAHIRDVNDAETIIQEGDAGETYYHILRGTVTAHATTQRRLGAGEGFGEIALLRDTPRTATVIADEPTTLVAIDRDTFLQAVQSHPQTLTTAQTLTTQRLRPQPATRPADSPQPA